jgi:hypothetical protein
MSGALLLLPRHSRSMARAYLRLTPGRCGWPSHVWLRGVSVSETVVPVPHQVACPASTALGTAVTFAAPVLAAPVGPRSDTMDRKEPRTGGGCAR